MKVVCKVVVFFFIECVFDGGYIIYFLCRFFLGVGVVFEEDDVIDGFGD